MWCTFIFSSWMSRFLTIVITTIVTNINVAVTNIGEPGLFEKNKEDDIQINIGKSKFLHVVPQGLAPDRKIPNRG